MLSIFGTETKIALTGVLSRVRESLALYFLLKRTHFFVKGAFQTNYKIN